MAPNKILITGGAGFVGSHLARRLLSLGHSVRILDDFSSSSAANQPEHARLEIVRGCVTDKRAVEEAVHDVHQIFHLAAVVGQIRVTDQPDRAYQVARASVANLNDIAPDTPTLFFSSSAVYGLTARGRCAENVTVTEAGALAYDGGKRGYAYGKWITEQLVTRRRSGTWLTVRPFNLIGPGQVGTYGMVVPRFVEAALCRRPYVIYGSGRQTRSFCDVGVFIKHLLVLHQAWIERRTKYSIYNLGNVNEISIEHLADTTDRVLGVNNQRIYVPFEGVYPGKQDVLRRQPTLARIHAELGDLSWPPIERSIADVADWLQSTSDFQSVATPGE